MEGQAKALCTSSKAIGLFIFQSLYKSLLCPQSGALMAISPSFTILQRQPAEHLDHLVFVNTTGRETEAPEAAPLPPVQGRGSEMARTSHVARKSHSCGQHLSPCCTTRLRCSVCHQGRGAVLLFSLLAVKGKGPAGFPK